MARSAGSGPRQLILLAAACAAVPIAGAQAPARPSPPPAAHGTSTSASADARPTAAASRQKTPPPTGARAPDAAVLEYLGEFDDAANGLDAMGLAEDDPAAQKPKQGGH